MPAVAWVAVIVMVVIAGWAVFTFNQLVRRRNRVDAGWAHIDAELQRRLDLVPSIVATVQGAADYERGVLERTTEARAAAVAAGAVEDRARAESTLTGALRSLFMVEEAYPDLRANASFLALQAELATAEERIAYARAYYNAAVAEYETSRQSFPSRMIAGGFQFTPRAYFEADVGSRAAVEVDLSHPPPDEPASREAAGRQ